MQLETIITLANRNVRLRFLAMERSLRASGCDLPLRVIPYDDQTFDLPANATWWSLPEMIDWTKRWKTHPTMRKYQCLTVPNHQFVDADVCFLRNPVEALAGSDGFITSCSHWHNPAETTTAQSVAFYKTRSTTWQQGIFNTGQWACDRALYALPELFRQAEADGFKETCVTFPWHEQPGVNLLVNASGVPIRNLTLRPSRMQSTWAGDYPGEYRSYWRTEEETPYLIHWAGLPMNGPRPINEIFLSYLTRQERAEWDEQVRAKVERNRQKARSLKGRFTSYGRALRNFTRDVFAG